MLVQVGQHAEDLERAKNFYRALLGRDAAAVYDPPGLVFFDLDAAVERACAAGAVRDTEPHAIFTHEDDTLGPAGTVEWHAFVRDTEGNLVGLVEHRRG